MTESPHVPDTERDLRTVHGRGMNSLSDAYKLPADRNEMDRLDLQHRVWTLSMGGLFPSQVGDTVKQLLIKKDGSQPMIMDIGTGSGIWAIDMAEAYPQAKVIGLDLSMSHRSQYPENCSFVQGDLTEGLSEHHGKFDIIHSRSVSGHLEYPAILVRVAGQCLKPGGLQLIGDGNATLWNRDKQSVAPAYDGEDNSNKSWFSRWMLEMVSRQAAKGPKRLGGDDLVPLLEADSQFENVGKRTLFAPINWAGDGIENGEQIGEYMKINLLTFIHASRPILIQDIPEETVNQWMKNVEVEMNNPDMRLYSKWDMAWAWKRAE